jgi:hypothetical protein
MSSTVTGVAQSGSDTSPVTTVAPAPLLFEPWSSDQRRRAA